MLATWAIVAGSIATGKVVEVPTFASAPCRSGETAEKFGSDDRSLASCGEKGENCDAVSIRSDRIVRSRTAVTEDLRDAANTATNVTSPSPIMSAAAVDAVRRGLRFAFSPPSLPETRRLNGRPSVDAIGRATSGDSIATPTNVSAAPSPTR